VGLVALVMVACIVQVRELIRAWAVAVLYGATAILPLLRVDGAATAGLLGLALAKIGLAMLPSVVLIRSAPRHRRFWLVPLVGILVIFSSPLSVAACATIDRWVLLAIVTAAATALTSVRYLRWTALLPFALLWEVVPNHGTMTFAQVGTDDPAYRDRLLVECKHHDGTRPHNLTADLLMPYHGINALGDDLVLLTGEGPYDGGMRGRSGGRRAGSWWLRRRDGVFEFESPSDATGNLWRGCVLDGTIWMARANYLVGTTRHGPGAATHEEVQRVRLPSSDVDFGETACDPDRGRVYVTEGLLGGIWEFAPGGGEPRRHEIGGVVLLPKRRFDGRVVLTNTALLMVFSPADDRVIENLPAGLAIIGFDMCPTDGTVAAADATGRLRVFEINDVGRYEFVWGTTLFAPRRVAYSRNCSRIAVTSADDRRVYIIDALEHRVVDIFDAGPALREVAATGPREFSITDVCSMTSYRW
jgi:hypothetical protein